jgi:hypothetical protein
VSVLDLSTHLGASLPPAAKLLLQLKLPLSL